MKWYNEGQPVDIIDGKKTGTDWDKARQVFEDKARAEIWKRLEEDRIKLATTHFKDFELLKGAWKHLYLEDATNEAGQKIKTGVDENGAPVYLQRRRKDLTPRDIQYMASAMRNIQEGQAKIFGDTAYSAPASATSDSGIPPDISPALIDRLEQAIDEATESDVDEADHDTEGD